MAKLGLNRNGPRFFLEKGCRSKKKKTMDE